MHSSCCFWRLRAQFLLPQGPALRRRSLRSRHRLIAMRLPLT